MVEAKRRSILSSILCVLLVLLTGSVLCEGGCVTGINVTVHNESRSLHYTLQTQKSTNCNEIETWDAILKTCNPNDDSTGKDEDNVKLSREGDWMRMNFNKQSGWRRLVVQEGSDTVSSPCFPIVGLLYIPEVTVEYTYEKLRLVLRGNDPRIQNCTFTVSKGRAGRYCYKEVIKEKTVNKDFEAIFPGPFNASTCLCVKLEVHSVNSLSYRNEVLNQTNCLPTGPEESKPEKEPWPGIIAGVCVGVVIVVILCAVIAFKKWRPFSYYTPKAEETPATTEVFVLYTPEQANRAPVMDLMNNLAGQRWKVTDLTSYPYKRLQDETKWVERLTEEQGVKVVVVDSPALHSIYASVLNSEVEGELDHDQAFLRFAVRQILDKHWEYDRIFVVSFTEEEDTNHRPVPEMQRQGRREGRLIMNDRKYFLPAHYDALIEALKGKKENNEVTEEGGSFAMNTSVASTEPIMV